LDWGSGQAENLNISNLCSEMRDDLKYFRKFHTSYPEKFTLIKFEDLSTDPFSNAQLLNNRIGIPFTVLVKNFIDLNTNIKSYDKRNENPYATERNSSKIAYEWINSLNQTFNLIAQDFCRDILQCLTSITFSQKVKYKYFQKNILLIK
jgi:hypothetical protein